MTYLARRVGLADGGRADAIPNAAGGEGGHGAATPHGATHAYSESQMNLAFILSYHIPVAVQWVCDFP